MVDDDPRHLDLVSSVFNTWFSPTQFSRALNGEDALRMLHESDPDDLKHGPIDLVMLDLDLPGIDGFAVLDEIRTRPETKLMPVIIVSNSSAKREKAKAYAMGANSYIVKPRDFEEMKSVMLLVDGYWNRTSELPPRGDERDDQ